MKLLPLPNIVLAVIAAALLAAVLIVPDTSWIVRRQMNPFLPEYGTAAYLARSAVVASEHPDDYDLQLAQAISLSKDRDSSQIAFDSLERRFPSSASAFANGMSIQSRFIRNIEWRAQELNGFRGEGPPETDDRQIPDSRQTSFLNDFLRECRAGEGLDPNNAYFPFVSAEAYFALHQDDEAVASLERAGRDSNWNQYAADPVIGRLRFVELIRGGMSGIERGDTVFMNDIYWSTRMLSLVRMATWEAEERERTRDFGGGLKIRHALMLCGMLMRAQGSMFLSNLNGTSIFDDAMKSPGGARGIAFDRTVPEEDAENRHRQEEFSAYQQYLAGHNFSEEARWVSAEFAAGEAMRSATELSNFNVLWQGLTGLDTELIIVSWIAFSWLMLAVIYWAKMAFLRRWLELKTPAASINRLIFCAVIWLLAVILLINGIKGGAAAMAGLEDVIPSYYPPTLVVYLLLLGITAGPYVVLTVLQMIRSALRREPAIRSLVDLTLRAAVPVFSLLVIVYCGAVIAQASEDRSIEQMYVEQLKLGEGQYLAKLNGKPWPGITNEQGK